MAMKKKTTIGGVPPKPKKATSSTNKASGYLNPNAAGNKKATPKTSTTVTKSGRKITVSASTSGGGTGNKTVKPGSMVTKPKLVPTKPANPVSFQGGQAAGYRNAPYSKAMGQGKLKRNTKNK
jgi:hypothetical protein